MKDFNKWNKLKQKLHNQNKRLYFHEREIWFCSLGANIGFEQDGKNQNFERPILIFKKFNNKIFWGIPLSSQIKQGKYYFKFNFKNKDSVAILSQLKLIDGKRLVRKFSTINKDDFFNLTSVLKNLF